VASDNLQGSPNISDKERIIVEKIEEIFFMDTYYQPEDLARFEEIGKEAPELARKFFDYYNAVFAEGELTEREKALIALAVSHAVQCPYCIDSYTRACLEKGSNLAEMTEAVHVVTAIRGGASLVHGVQMRNIARKLSM
jgi:4-carboxymuconolactone decarboxylase